MKKYASKGFMGTYALDQIKTVNGKPKGSSFSFVMNTEPITTPIGHWVSVMVDKDTIEYFDPFGTCPSERFYKEIKKILPSGVYQNKSNRVNHQTDPSQNCGWHAIRFLVDRYSGKSFKVATGFETIDKSAKSEKQMERFKKTVKRFGFISVKR
jgi:hypothetical protein